MTLLRITNLVKHLGSAECSFTLRVPVFQLEAASELVLVGESGSGKTTLFHLIAGIITADEGSIEIDGTDIVRLNEAQRDRFRAAHLGLIYQTFNLLQGFTALENVLVAATFGADSRTGSGHPSSALKRRATELLSRLGLGNVLHQKPHELSVGQQQRVAVARALLCKPKLILADEPTANVDAANAARVIEEIRALARDEGAALIVISHDEAVRAMFPRSQAMDSLLGNAPV
jgi:putative ABC transport system ATP-binding protein